MRTRFAASVAIAALLLSLAVSPAVAQSSSSGSFQAPLGYPSAPAAAAKPAKVAAVKGKKAAPATDIKPLRQFAIGGFAGTTGFGGEAAIRLLSVLNLRGGGEYFSYSGTLTNNGINITPKLELGESFLAADYFPFHGGFHISPGVMLHNFDTMNAVVGVPAGQSFTVNGTTYYSYNTNPLSGNVSLSVPNTAFRGTIGFSNMIPIHTGKHITFPFEFGVLYFPSTSIIKLNFAGVVCTDQAQTQCSNFNPSVQTEFNNSVSSEQAKLQKDDFNQSYAHFYPIIKWGIAYKF